MEVHVGGYGHQVEVVRVEEQLSVRVGADYRVYDVTIRLDEAGQVPDARLGKGQRSLVVDVARVRRTSVQRIALCKSELNHMI